MGRQIRPARLEGEIAYIQLTKGHEAIIDASDVPLVSCFNWFADEDLYTTYAIRNLRVDGRATQMAMHRYIMGNPKGMHIDHIDGNGLNNRRANLRIATPHQNQCNRRMSSNNTSGYKGVSQDNRTGRWLSRIKVLGVSKHLGLYDTAEEAHAAYVKASAVYHGDFGRVE